jgi:hypothetical protein
MNRVSIGLGALLVVITAIVSAQQPQRPAEASKGLRIVVLEGEDAVNIVQQKTAVRPMVEVRDSNNLPVAGASVQFTIARTGGGAAASFANGQTAVTVTTDAVGRAATSPLQALGNGAVRINVQATYQGQVASATVSQTNFATVAEAARAGRTPTPSTGGGAGTGAGAGGAGGASGGAAGVVGTAAGAAAAGLSGALAANEIKKENDSCRSSADTFSADLSAALDACVISTASASCQSASQTAAGSLGAWCTCDGVATVDAQLRAEGSSLAQLQTLAGFPRVQFPASCR